jgi:hypothetical protein
MRRIFVCARTFRIFDKATTEEKSAHTKAMLYVRDKLGAHAYESALSGGLLEHLKAADEGLLWRHTKPQVFRTLFMDDIISWSWQSQAMTVPKGQNGIPAEPTYGQHMVLIANS